MVRLELFLKIIAELRFFSSAHVMPPLCERRSMRYFSSDWMLFFIRDYRMCLCHVRFQHQMVGQAGVASEAVILDTGC